METQNFGFAPPTKISCGHQVSLVMREWTRQPMTPITKNMIRWFTFSCPSSTSSEYGPVASCSGYASV